MTVGGENKRKKMILRPKNESARCFNEIWSFGRLHTSRLRWGMVV